MAEGVLQTPTVMTISAMVNSLQDCWQLAEALSIEQRDFKKLRKRHQDVPFVAMHILQIWITQNGDKATGQALYAILNRSVKHLAHRFCAHLVGRNPVVQPDSKDPPSNVLLKEGMPLLYEISRLFSDDEEVVGLAVYLLKDVERGGRAFVKNLGELRPPAAAHAVLEKWCSQMPREAYGARLLEVLEMKNVNPRAAEDFRSALLADVHPHQTVSEPEARGHLIEPSTSARFPPSFHGAAFAADSQPSSRHGEAVLPSVSASSKDYFSSETSNFSDNSADDSGRNSTSITRRGRQVTAMTESTRHAVAVINLPNRLEEVEVILDQDVFKANENIFPCIDDLVKFALGHNVGTVSIRIRDLKAKQPFDSSQPVGYQTLCVICVNVAGNLDTISACDRDALKRSIQVSIAQLLEIPNETVHVRVIASGNSIQIVLTSPSRSAESLVQLWQADQAMVKDIFLNPSFDKLPIEVLSIEHTAGGKYWPITPRTLFHWKNGWCEAHGASDHEDTTKTKTYWESDGETLETQHGMRSLHSKTDRTTKSMTNILKFSGEVDDIDSAADVSNVHRTILIFGKIQTGKSALGNVIAGGHNRDSPEEDFEEGLFPLSTTVKAKEHLTEIAGKRYRIIDTVGIGHTFIQEETILTKFAQIFHYLRHGLNQMLFVTHDTITKEEMKVLKFICGGLLGEDIRKFVTIVRTKASYFLDVNKCKADIHRLTETNPFVREFFEHGAKIIHVNNPRKDSSDNWVELREKSRASIVARIEQCNELYNPPALTTMTKHIKNYIKQQHKLQKEVEERKQQPEDYEENAKKKVFEMEENPEELTKQGEAAKDASIVLADQVNKEQTQNEREFAKQHSEMEKTKYKLEEEHQPHIALETMGPSIEAWPTFPLQQKVWLQANPLHSDSLAHRDRQREELGNAIARLEGSITTISAAAKALPDGKGTPLCLCLEETLRQLEEMYPRLAKAQAESGDDKSPLPVDCADSESGQMFTFATMGMPSQSLSDDVTRPVQDTQEHDSPPQIVCCLGEHSKQKLSC